MSDFDLSEMKVAYLGRKGRLLKIGLFTGFLTLLTVGIYRFWARTRVRKYLWSSINPGGHSFEYNGTGLEKFLGFLIAVAVLAVYLGIAQLFLLFFGYSLFTQGETLTEVIIQNLLIYSVALVALPLVYYAQYRARRYILSRTRWRGIRFGAEPAAWGYVKLALKNLFFTIISLGILLPRQTFNLEKYRTDRTYFGSAKFHQSGEWRMLRPAMTQVYIGAVICLISVIAMFVVGLPDIEPTVTESDVDVFPENFGAFMAASSLLSVGYVWLFVGFSIYNTATWRIMANHKTLDDRISFRSEVDTSDVIMAYIFGGILAFFVALVLALIMGTIIGFISNPFISALELIPGDEMPAGFLVGTIFGYLAFFIFFGAIALVSITQPVLRNFASSLTILNSDALNEITQREGDDFVEAEGFADALDVGAAF